MQIKTRIITLAAVGAIVAAGLIAAATVVSAQEPEATPDQAKHEKRIERRDNFLSRVAAKLDVTLDQLKTALKSAATDMVDDALAAGEITQQQADAAKSRIENGDGIGLRRLLGARTARREAIVQRVRAAIVQSAADALNMTPEELRAELKSGKSIADVAGDNIDAVKTQITADATAKLDAAVANGKLTQAQADKALQKLTDNLDKIVNKTRGQAVSAS